MNGFLGKIKITIKVIQIRLGVLPAQIFYRA